MIPSAISLWWPIMENSTLAQHRHQAFTHLLQHPWDGKGGVIIIFNMNPGKPTGEWNQIMTLPRKLTLVGRDEIRQEPAGDIESLRYDKQEVKATETSRQQGSRA